MSKNERMIKKSWPENCPWPEPMDPGCGMLWEDDWVDPLTVDERVDDLLEIKDYYDGLVEEDILDDSYYLNEDADLEDSWEPEKGEEYWFDSFFDYDYWLEDFSEAMNCLKITDDRQEKPFEEDAVEVIEDAIDYRFINENLLRQAFTRRSFAVEYGIDNQPYRSWKDSVHAGCSEELEYLGDSVLNMVVTKEILKLHAVVDESFTAAPFKTRYDEGIFSKMRSRFTCKEHLAKRATDLGLDRFILYGTGEEASESALEDMMEALIGAVVIDTNWNMDTIEKLIDRLLELHIDCPDSFLKKDYFNILNSWHQKHFGCFPKYEVDGWLGEYSAVLRYQVPGNTKEVRRSQLVVGEGSTRSEARSKAAERAVYFLAGHGLWMNLQDSGIVPDKENCIGQLQELYQKKYISELPVYEFQESVEGEWFCDCYFESFHTYGKGSSKIKAKKAAAFMGLESVYRSISLGNEINITK